MTPPPVVESVQPSRGATLPGRHTLSRSLPARLADRVYLALLGVATSVALGLVGYLVWVTAAQTGPVWDAFGVVGFLTGTDWVVSPPTGGPRFGALPFITGTLTTSIIAMAIAVPLAVGIALATTLFLPRPLRAPLAAVIDLLAAVPSVVYGFWGTVVLVPWARPGLEAIAAHNLRVLAAIALLAAVVAAFGSGALRWLAASAAAGLTAVVVLALAGVVETPVRMLKGPVLSGSYLMAGLVLGIMVLPTITAVSREVLATVPRDQREGAMALGATRWETARHAMLPWARSGIVGASALGLGRAMGETIALALVLGNVPNILGSLVGPGSTAAGVIALETGEATTLQLAALTALAVMLFVLTVLVNGAARALVGRGPRAHRGGATSGPPSAAGPGATSAPQDAPATTEPALAMAGLTPVTRARRIRSGVAEVAVFGSVVIGLVPLVLILGEIVVKGVGSLSASFLTEVQPTDPNSIAGHGIGNALVGTLIMVGMATAMAAPLGILTGLLMFELARMGGRPGRVAGMVGFAVDVMLGMPSIVVGLTVYLAVVVPTQGFSALAGAIALAIVMFPIVVRTADEVLRLVPRTLTEASLALGAPRWRTSWSVVLPASAPGVLTGVVLAVGRGAGETAPLLFSSLGNQFMSTDVTEPIAALPQLIFQFLVQVRTPQSVSFAWGATFVLVAFVLILNVTARLATRLGGRGQT